jgi:amino acid permease
VAGRIAQIAFVLVVTASYPLQHFAGRVNLAALIFRKLDPTAHPRYMLFHVLCATGYVVGSYGLAATGLDLGLVIGIAGSTGGQLFLFILPGVFFLRIRKKKEINFWSVISVISIIVGCCLMVVSLYATVGIHIPPCTTS